LDIDLFLHASSWSYTKAKNFVINLISSYPKDIQFYLNKYVKIHCGFIACKNVKQRYHSSGPVRNIVTMMALQAAA